MLRFLLPPWQNLWKNRELLWQFTLRNIEIRHKGSHLGLIWSFLNPLLMLALYVFVFGYIFGGKFGVNPNETKAEYALGVFLSLTIFQFFAETLGASPGVIASNPNFVKKVVFPLEILPIANTAAAAFHMLISLSLAVIGMLIFGVQFGVNAFYLPALLLPLLMLGFGVAWFFSAFGVFLRDINQLIQFLTLALMYASAVFYPSSKIPAQLWDILKFNPLLLIIEQTRDIMLWQRPPHVTYMVYLYIMSIIVFYAGNRVFNKLKPTFADVI